MRRLAWLEVDESARPRAYPFTFGIIADDGRIFWCCTTPDGVVQVIQVYHPDDEELNEEAGWWAWAHQADQAELDRLLAE